MWLPAALPNRVTEATLARYLYHPDIPDVDLFIRSSGEQRLSNFLLWQSSYAEFVFLDTLWPDFDRRHFWQACEIYARRDRRYGGAGTQPGGAAAVRCRSAGAGLMGALGPWDAGGLRGHRRQFHEGVGDWYPDGTPRGWADRFADRLAEYSGQVALRQSRGARQAAAPGHGYSCPRWSWAPPGDVQRGRKRPAPPERRPGPAGAGPGDRGASAPGSHENYIRQTNMKDNLDFLYVTSGLKFHSESYPKS